MRHGTGTGGPSPARTVVGMPDTPAAEVTVDADLVRALLGDQHPDLAHLPLRLATNGWDNSVWRLGSDLAVRLPRRAVAAPLVEQEQRWLPVLAARVAATVDVVLPVPVRTGTPTVHYPWRWSVVPWVDGRSAGTVPPAARTSLAGPLARFVRALHLPAPSDAPANPVRGGPLTGRDAVVRDRLGHGSLPRAAELLALWTELAATPSWSGPPTWLHGDLHPHNLVVDDAGELAAVVDFGDLTAGDPATDLATAWLTFDATGRARFRAALADRYDTATWRRARGWALSMATAMVTMSDDEPVIRAIGHHTLGQVLMGEEEPPPDTWTTAQ